MGCPASEGHSHHIVEAIIDEDIAILAGSILVLPDHPDGNAQLDVPHLLKETPQHSLSMSETPNASQPSDWCHEDNQTYQRLVACSHDLIGHLLLVAQQVAPSLPWPEARTHVRRCLFGARE